MRAVGLYKYLPIENPESLLDVEVPKPEARGRCLLVRVKAVAVNPVDTKVRSPKEGVESLRIRLRTFMKTARYARPYARSSAP